MISPLQIELRYTAIEQRLNQKLAKVHGLVLVAATLATLALILLANETRYDIRYDLKRVGAFGVMSGIRHGIFAALILSLPALVIPARFQVRFQFACMAMVWLATSFFYSTWIASGWLRIYSAVSLPLVCLGGWVFLRHSLLYGASKAGAFAFSIYFWVIMGGLTWLLLAAKEPAAESIWQVRAQFLWLSVLVVAFKRELSREDFFMAVNPVNGLRGILWPAEARWRGDNVEERRALWWRGLTNIYFGYLCLLFVTLFHREFNPRFEFSFSATIAHYFTLIFVSVGVFNILAGVVRLFGYSISDPTQFVLLSRNPADFWRRLNVYNYLFVLRYVFMPLKRRMKGFTFLVTLLSFFVFYINHQGFWNVLVLGSYAVGVELPLPNAGLRHMQAFFVTFLALFFLLYTTRHIWFFPGPGRKSARWAWLSVLVTHFLMICAFHSRILVLLWE